MENQIRIGNTTLKGAKCGNETALFIEKDGKLLMQSFDWNKTIEKVKNELIQSLNDSGCTITSGSFGKPYYPNWRGGSIQVDDRGEYISYTFYCLQDFTFFINNTYWQEWETPCIWNKGIGGQIEAIQILSLWYSYNFKPLQSISDIKFISVVNGVNSKEYNFTISSSKYTVLFNSNGMFSILTDWF